MDITAALDEVFDGLGVTPCCWAEPVAGGNDAQHVEGVGVRPDRSVAPASVMKIQVAVAVFTAISRGELDGSMPVTVPVAGRTPGPVGMSLMADPVTMSVRDLVWPMLTVSDNAATDVLTRLVGIDAVNAVTAGLGLTHTRIVEPLIDHLDRLARAAGFEDYPGMAAYDPGAGGRGDAEIRAQLADSDGLDPERTAGTTARETVRLLQAIWRDEVDPAAAEQVRRVLARQVSKARIASGFGSDVTVAAKSGTLFVVRNEAGVVTLPSGDAYAVAVFTRIDHPERDLSPDHGQRVDAAMGRAARIMVDALA